MHVHRKHLSELIRVYAKGDDDEQLKREIARWRHEVQCGVTVTLPGLPPVHVDSEPQLDDWLRFRFPRLFPSD